MRPLLIVAALAIAACSTVASSAPELGAAPVVQFTETSWPVQLTNLPGWEQSNFVFGLPPRITSTGGQGTALDVRSREGDTLVALSFAAAGVGTEVFDLMRPAGFSQVSMPLKAPHLMAPGEGLVIQLDAGGAGYKVSAIQATWTRPL